MANAGEVSVALKLDDTDFLAGLEAAGTSLEAFSREISRLARPPELTAGELLSVPDTGAAFAGAGAQAGTAFSGALAAALSTDAFTVAAQRIADAFSAVPIADQLSAALARATGTVDADLSSALAQCAEFAGTLAQSLAEAGTEAGTALTGTLATALTDMPTRLAQTGSQGALALAEGLMLGSPQLGSAASALMETAGAAASAAADKTLSSALAQSTEFVGALARIFSEAGTEAGAALTDTLTVALTDMPARLAHTGSRGALALAEGLMLGSPQLGSAASALMETAGAAASAAAYKTLPPVLAQSAEFAGTLAQNLAEAGTEAGAALTGTLATALTDMPARLVQTGSRGAQSLVEGFMLGQPQVSSAASTLIKAALRAAGASAAAANGIGLSFASGLAGGIRAGRSGVVSAAIAVAQAAAGAARGALDIHSPSRVTEELGHFFDLGFIEGVRDKQPDIDRSVRAAVQLPPPPGAIIGTSAGILASGRTVTAPIDYAALAEAMSQYQPVLVMNSRRVAEIQTNETARTQSRRGRRVALGYGK